LNRMKGGRKLGKRTVGNKAGRKGKKTGSILEGANAGLYGKIFVDPKGKPQKERQGSVKKRRSHATSGVAIKARRRGEGKNRITPCPRTEDRFVSKVTAERTICETSKG